MTDEDIIIASTHVARDESVADFEPILETMIAIAQNQGRRFLAYLLVMALMHAREENGGRTEVPH